MVKTKTPEEFLVEVEELVGEEYTVLEDYVTSKTKILFRHNTCGYEYKNKPNHFLTGKRCPLCAKRLKRTNKQFLLEINELVGDEYTFLEPYETASSKILVTHNSCGYTYKVTPSDFINGGKRCLKCSGLMKKTTESFKQEIKKLSNNEFSLISEYENSDTKVTIRHNTCKHSWDVSPSSFLSRVSCPRCNTSNGESLIASYLTEKGIKYTPEFTFKDLYYRSESYLLRFDFAVLDRNDNVNLLIEYDGEQHFKNMYWDNDRENLTVRKERDELKNRYCESRSIPLLRIPYTDLSNINNILEEVI